MKGIKIKNRIKRRTARS